MPLKDFHNANLKGKCVFLRVDYNVPVDNGNVTDDFKIVSSLSTIREIYQMNSNNIVIGTHLGRPGGVFDSKFSIRPVFDKLKILIKENFNEDLIMFEDEKSLNNKFVILENLRFYPEEEDLSLENGFLADFFDKYIQIVIVDAFGCLHRKAFSIIKTGKPTYAGNLIKTELEAGKQLFSEEIDLLILGGCKVLDKITILQSLIGKCKAVFIVGGIAYSFLKHHDHKEVGKSIVSVESKGLIDEIYRLADIKNCTIYLPEDFVVQNGDTEEIVNVIPATAIGCDIGPLIIRKLHKVVSKSEVIFWNGTPGMFENEKFSSGTRGLVKMLAEQHKASKVVVGGGETSECVRRYSNTSLFHHVSTGGGAFLKLLTGDELPGLRVLEDEDENETVTRFKGH